MKVLFIGGTGNISLACSREVLAKGWELYHLNRGTQRDLAPEGVKTLTADVRNRAELERAVSGMSFDAVVDWIAFTPEHVRTDIDVFAGKTAQYVFISSASAYVKPLPHHIVTESTPIGNRYWQYSQDKADCEKALREAVESSGFPATVVRPSHTYSDGWLPTTFGSRDWTPAARMLAGKRIVVHGDGTSLWTITHADDFARAFVGLLGNPAAVGESFHITSDEALTWDDIHGTIGYMLGVEPRIVHIPSDFIARFYPERGAGLLGDKAYSVVFDNSKIKRFVPGYRAVVPFHEGMRRSVAWYEAHPEKKVSDPAVEAEIDRLLELWDRAVSG
jgi:nucleoside-diphosphate-sugar epimerase